MAKTSDEMCMDAIEAYRSSHPGGAFRMEDVAQWVLDNNILPEPKIKPVRLMTRNLKQAARRKRFRDLQGRKVRKVLAVKIEQLQAGGQKVMDVVWDYLHEMSADHALSAFQQRDEIIEKQRLAATRDVHSFIDNNPNAAGHEYQFQCFAFMLESPAEIVEEQIDESAVPPTTHPDLEPDDASTRPVKNPR